MNVQLYKKVSGYFILCLLVGVSIPIKAVAQTSTLIHFWSFTYFDTINVLAKGIPYTSSTYTGSTNNNSNPSIKADYSIIDTNKAVLAYKWQAGTSTTYGGFYDNYPAVATDFDTVNARTIPGYNTNTLATIQGVANANNAFRDRTPADKSYLLFYIPSTGYQNLVFTYGVQSSNGTNCKYDTFYYSIDSGVNFIQSGISKTWDSTVLGTTSPFTFKKVTVNITDPSAINNPKLVFKVTLGPANGGNDRFDNVSLDGVAIISISSQPVSSTITVGANTSFSVAATGVGTLTYQWQVNTGTGFTNITNGGFYSNATTNTLNITGATLAMSGYQYQCVITNSSPAYSLTSSTAISWTYIPSSTLIHFWHFNNWNNAGVGYATINSNNGKVASNQLIKADYSIIDTNKAALTYNWLAGTASTYAGYYDNAFVSITTAGSNVDYDSVNVRTVNGYYSQTSQTVAGVPGFTNAFRNRNPSDKSYLVFNIPSTGYQNLVFTYAVEASNATNCHTDTFAYSLDSGATWSQSGINKTFDTTTNNGAAVFKRITVNITDPSAANNNKLAFKVWQGAANTGASGNDRYDNVSLDGTSIVPTNAYAVSISGTSACFPSVLTLNSATPPLQVIWQNNGTTVSTVLPTNNTTATTVGGTGTAGSGLIQLSFPTGVQRDATGNIYICDQANNRVVKWASPYVTGTVVAGTGTAGNALTQLNSPQQVYVDASANVYVSDKGNNRVVMWPSPYTTGAIVAGGNGVGTGTNQFNGPTGIAVDGSGNLYVADSGNSRILKFGPNSTSSTSGSVVAGYNGVGTGANQLSSPIGIAVDASGNLYIADKGNNRIQQFPAGSTSLTNGVTVAGNNGGTSGSTADKLNAPVSVRLDVGGFMYITDQGNNRIQRWVPGSGAGTTILTYSAGTSATQLNNPYDTYVDSNGNLYVADYNNARVQKFTTTTTYTPTAAGSYTAIVTSAYGTSTTTAFAVNSAASVTGNPSNTTICQGTNTTFVAAGTGGSLVRQWQVNTGTGFTNITNGGVYSGASTDSLKITGALATMTGYIYQCVYSNPCTASAISGSATLTVTPTPAIGTQPTATSVCAGLNTTISTTATGAGLTYQWMVNPGSGYVNATGGVYSGGTTTTLTITGATLAMNGYLYECVVSGTCTPPATTAPVVLTVNSAPGIGTAPVNSTVCANSNDSFTVAATGAGLTYQWQISTGGSFSNISNGGVYSGAISNKLLITGVLAGMNGYQYQCVVSGTCTPPVTSSAGILSVNTAPAIGTQPVNATTCNNGNASFTVATTGAGLTYQWFYYNGSFNVALSNTGIYSGATTNTLTLTGATLINNGATYQCVISGTCTPPVTTNNVILTVNPNPSLSSNVIASSICSTTALSYSPTSSVGGTTYSWSRASVANITPSTGTGTGSIGETLTNSSNSPVVVTYNYVLTASGCVTNQSITDTVFPSPTVTAPLPQAVCNASNTTAITISGSAVAGTTYNWANNTTSIGLAASGIGNMASFTASNSTNAPVIGTISITPIANGCAGTAQNFSITVNPTPTVNTINNQVVCNGLITTLISIGGPVTGTTFSWTNTAASIGLASSGSGNTIGAFSVANTSTSPVVATVTVTPLANTCTGTQRIFTITANPTPTVTQPPNQVVCNGTIAGAVTFSGAVTGTTFSWSNTTASIGLGLSGNGNISSFTATNTSTAPVIATVSVTPAANACNGLAQNFTVTVNPTPAVILPPNQTVCNNVATTALSFSSLVSGATYSWTNSATSIGLAANGAGNISSFTATNGTNAAVIATIAVTPTANSCPGNAQNFTITVNPTPGLTLPGSQVVCNGISTAASSFTGAVSGTIFNWTNNSTSIGIGASGSGNIPSFNAVNTTTSPVISTITVTPFANSCSGTSQGFTYTVNPTPNVSLPSNQVVCNNVVTSALSFSGNVSGTTYSWTNSATSTGLSASGTGNIAAFTATNSSNAPVVANVSVTPTANACPGNAQAFTITVNPTPNVTLPSNQIVCNGLATSALSFNSLVSGTSYSWTNNTTSINLPANGNGNISSFVAYNTGNSPVVATLLVTPTANSCAGSSQSFTITVNPTPVVTNPTNQVLCNGSSISPVTFSGSAVSGTSYNWSNNTTSIGLGGSGIGNISSFNAINNSTSPVVSTITVTPTANSCSGQAQVFSITVNPTPVLNSSLNAQAACSNSSFAYTPTSATSGTSYSWSRASVTNISPSTGSGNGNVNETLTNSTPNPIVVTYSYTLSANGCSSSQTLTDTVKPMPTLSSSLLPMSSCSNFAFNYIPSSATNGTTFSWSRANIFNITPGATNGTGNVNETLVNATPSPIVVNYVYAMLANGCSNSQTISDTIKPTPNLTSTTLASICNNTLFTYNPASATSNTTYTWSRSAVVGITPSVSSGTGGVSETLNNATPNPVAVTYLFALSANSCINLQYITDTIKPSPVLTSTLVPPAICNNTTFSYVPASSTTGTTFAWSRAATPGISNSASAGSGNPNEVLMDTASASVNVTYVYSLSANGCTNPTVYNVVVTVYKQPGIMAQPSSSTICAGNSTAFTVIGSGTNPTYQWTVDTGSGFHNVLNSSVYSGATSNTLTLNNTPLSMNGYVYQCVISGACNPQVYSSPVSLTVNALPFIASQPLGSTICAGGNTTFSIVATGTNINYQWQVNAGLGFVPVSNNSIYSGVNTPTLSITAATSAMSGYQYICKVGGTCTPPATSIVANLTINPNPLPPVNTSGPVAFCAGDSVNLHTTSGANYSYQWQMNGGPLSGGGNSSYEAHFAGSYTVTVTNNYGCTATSLPTVVTVYLYPSANINTLLGNLTFCQGDSVMFGTNTNFGLAYQWQNNSVNIPTATNVTYTAHTSGNYRVLVSQNGCLTPSAIEVVLVDPVPNDTLPVTGRPVICSGGNGTFLLSAIQAVGQTYLWYHNGVSIPGASSYQFPATSGGWYNVLITNNLGCSIFTQSVYVSAITSPSPIITASGLTLDAGINYATYQWFFNGTSIPGAISRHYTATLNGIYSVNVTDTNGCSGTSNQYTISGLGVGNTVISGKDVKIFPNPATSVVHIEAPVKVNISVMGMDSKQVIRREDATTIDISQLANGVYMIQVYTADNVLLKTERLIKNNW